MNKLIGALILSLNLLSIPALACEPAAQESAIVQQIKDNDLRDTVIEDGALKAIGAALEGVSGVNWEPSTVRVHAVNLPGQVVILEVNAEACGTAMFAIPDAIWTVVLQRSMANI